MNKQDKLYMKWWFWVVMLVVFIFVLSVFFIPDSSEELDDELLTECLDLLDDWDEWHDEYIESIEDYCEIVDYENELCDALLP